MQHVAAGGTSAPSPAWVEMLLVLVLALGTPTVILWYRWLSREIQRGLRTYALGGQWAADESGPTDVLWAAPFPVIIAVLIYGMNFDPGTPHGTLLSRASETWSPWLAVAGVSYVAAFTMMLTVGIVSARGRRERSSGQRALVTTSLAVSAGAIAVLVAALASESM